MSTGARPEDKAGHLSLDWGKRILNYLAIGKIKRDLFFSVLVRRCVGFFP